ncbi:unnamed protein product [marine sediment metagenome]|uniref:YcgL domain-containing protein n=1 Tax=marine sediment metagenome TaxID=412755 RepID=X1EKN1_9ZZZZ
MKIKCEVYRCSRKADTYLYLGAGKRLEELPDGLKSLLGDLTQFLNLELNESSKLAQVKTSEVLTALGDQGYFLQMPPADLLKSQTPGSGYIQ